MKKELKTDVDTADIIDLRRKMRREDSNIIRNIMLCHFERSELLGERSREISK